MGIEPNTNRSLVEKLLGGKALGRMCRRRVDEGG
jgi:hypothetical protein